MSDASIETLSPHEYLEHLQHEQYGDKLPPFAADVGDVLTANLIGILPVEHRAQLERIAVGVLPTKSINAWVSSVPSGGEVIGFDFGMLSFMLALNKILLSRISLFGLEPTIEHEAAASRAATIVRSFGDDQEFPRLTVSSRKMLIASALSNVQSAFVIGHELGHVLLGHLREYRVAGPPEQPHEMEFAADLRGAELVLNGYGYSRGVIADRDAELGQAGIDMFFTYMIFMDAVLGRREDEFSSHPSSKDRRQKLRDRYLRGLPDGARQLAGAAEKLFEAFAQTAANKQTK